MRAILARTALAAALGSSFAARAQEPEESSRRWYGWQIMLADAASIGIGVASSAATHGPSSDSPGHVIGQLATAGFLLASPLIHAVGHEQYGRAVAAVLLRDVPLVAAALLRRDCANSDACPGRYYVGATLGIVGLVGVVLDWTALSWEPAPAPRVAVVPIVGKANGAAVAVRF
jgi:hypothetical protein